ncbi:MAG: PEP-CTERM sorting domain-containing protein [Thiotrichales bacterium]|nr:MAG: PEP-CTERM sorting domain-containing protein [Thiotrichales bacterium]
MKIISKIKLLIGVVLFGASLQVYAIPSINGEIGMGGNFIPIDSGSNPTSIIAATGVDFDPNLFIVNSATGDFSGVGALGTILDFQFDPFAGPIIDFWTIDGFGFELTSVSKLATNDPNRFLILSGTGIISKSGFADTLGIWNFTGDSTSGGAFSWSAGSTGLVPEPGVLALLAIGLIGLVGRVRLNK